MTMSLIDEAVAMVLNEAAGWLGWNGTAVCRDGNVWTPHKSLRRVADHLLDHLAEIECRLAGQPAVPDTWHGRAVTVDADWARFTEIDLAEATSRLTRYAAWYRARLSTLDDATLDAVPADGSWPLREVVAHVAGVTYYAEMMRSSSATSTSGASTRDGPYQVRWRPETSAHGTPGNASGPSAAVNS